MMIHLNNITLYLTFLHYTDNTLNKIENTSFHYTKNTLNETENTHLFYILKKNYLLKFLSAYHLRKNLNINLNIRVSLVTRVTCFICTT